MHIRQFENRDKASVSRLWNDAFSNAEPWNAPSAVIERKLRTQPDLFFVGEADGKIVAAVMAGFDGVRGWIYSLVVAPEYRRLGFGRRLLEHASRSLRQRGCPKINLQVRSSNDAVLPFYDKLGFKIEGRVSLGKPLESIEKTTIAEPVPTLNVDSTITLSQITYKDKPTFLKYLNQSDVFHRYTETIPYPYTESDADLWLAKVANQTVQQDRCQAWAIRNGNQELIGSIGLIHLSPGEKAEIGYWLAQPYWGRDITTRAVRRLCRFGFEQHKLVRIYARVLEGNPASSRVLEKAGFDLEGRRRKHFFRDGQAFDDCCYGLLREATS